MTKRDLFSVVFLCFDLREDVGRPGADAVRSVDTDKALGRCAGVVRMKGLASQAVMLGVSGREWRRKRDWPNLAMVLGGPAKMSLHQAVVESGTWCAATRISFRHSDRLAGIVLGGPRLHFSRMNTRDPFRKCRLDSVSGRTRDEPGSMPTGASGR
jgi:hypothetical protein